METKGLVMKAKGPAVVRQQGRVQQQKLKGLQANNRGITRSVRAAKAKARGGRGGGCSLGRLQAAVSSTSNIAGEDVGPKDAPLRSLFPEEPASPKPGAPKLKVAIVGGGLAGLSTAVELLDQGHEVEIYEARTWSGGKVASYKDRDGNHIEMGLHVFFGCYFNVFRLMAKTGGLSNFLLKDHTHTFCNEDGDVRELDFRFFLNDTKIGAPFHGLKAFFTTPQLDPIDKAANALALGTSPIVRALIDPEGGMEDIRGLDNVSFTDWFTSKGGSMKSIERMWNPIAYALGFIDCNDISARCMLTIFQFFATKTDSSVLRMLAGSPEGYLLKPIVDYIEERGGKIHLKTGCREILYAQDEKTGKVTVNGLRIGQKKVVKADAYVAALDVPGAKKLIPQPWKDTMKQFGDIENLVGVPVITVQLRYDNWVTEMQEENSRGKDARGIDNLLYSADADFSCFADLALTSPWDYYKEGEGSLLQCVITPPQKGAISGRNYFKMPKDEIVKYTDEQVRKLFPSARKSKLLWSSVVKIAQSLYKEAPGLDVYRPDQQTPIDNFFLAGSYTKQDYIDSMEGATLSGRLCAGKIVEVAEKLEQNSKASAELATASTSA
jgi:zeta-carotene desaturase